MYGPDQKFTRGILQINRILIMISRRHMRAKKSLKMNSPPKVILRLHDLWKNLHLLLCYLLSLVQILSEGLTELNPNCMIVVLLEKTIQAIYIEET